MKETPGGYLEDLSAVVPDEMAPLIEALRSGREDELEGAWRTLVDEALRET